jgi:hypothetical protein
MTFDPPQFEMSESGKEFQKALAAQYERFYGIIDRLTAERDEARREVSFLRPSVCLGAQTAHEYAESRGWDCFEKPKTEQQKAMDRLSQLDEECGL